MPKRFVPIRIRENDKAEYARLVKNAKAKLRRTQKNYGIDLSNEIDLPPLSSFQTREQFNEFKQNVSSFTNRNNWTFQFQKNKYDVVASKKEIAEAERATKKAQLKAKQLIEKYENRAIKRGGEESGTVKQEMLQMGKPNVGGINVPKDFNFNSIQSRKRFEDKKRSMEKRAYENEYDKRSERMRDNYIKMLEEQLNSDADTLIEKIMELNGEEFFELYVTNREFDFDLYYNEESGETAISKMMGIIEQYDFEKNKDIRGF